MFETMLFNSKDSLAVLLIAGYQLVLHAGMFASIPCLTLTALSNLKQSQMAQSTIYSKTMARLHPIKASLHCVLSL